MAFDNLQLGHYGAILADPPWRFRTWNNTEVIKPRGYGDASANIHYRTMTTLQICELPVATLATNDCALFLWTSWPQIYDALAVIESWGFEYKTCAFCWTKAHAGQIELFDDDVEGLLGMGYWTRANSEPCLLATRGKPKRINADVRQAIIEPRREHSRKPSCVGERIERLVAGPYLELFAREQRPGWDCWGDQVDKFAAIPGFDMMGPDERRRAEIKALELAPDYGPLFQESQS